MAKLAKILVMLVRLDAVAALAFGVWVSMGSGIRFLNVHIALGFVMALCLALLALMAFVKREVPVAVVGLVFAGLIPYVGFKQFPIKFGPGMSTIQIAHVVVVLIGIGVAEMLHGKIRKASSVASITTSSAR